MTLDELRTATLAPAGVGAYTPPAPQDRGAALVLLGAEIAAQRADLAARLACVGAQPHRFRQPD